MSLNTEKDLGPLWKGEYGNYMPKYPVPGDSIIEAAITLLGQRFLRTIILDTPQQVRDFFMARLEQLEGYYLDMAFLDVQYRVLGYHRLPLVTVIVDEQHKRRIVQWALELDASQVVFAHKNKSNIQLDREQMICDDLKQLLVQLNIGVSDYLSIQATTVLSFAEEGYLRKKESDVYDEDIYQYDAESLREGGFEVPFCIG